MAADYMAAYLDVGLSPTNQMPWIARAVSKKYRNCPVLSWRKRFRDLGKQVYEIWMAARMQSGAGSTDMGAAVAVDKGKGAADDGDDDWVLAEMEMDGLNLTADASTHMETRPTAAAPGSPPADVAELAADAQAADGDPLAVDPFTRKRSSGPKASAEPFLQACLVTPGVGAQGGGGDSTGVRAGAMPAVVSIRYANVGSVRVDVFAFDEETFFSAAPFALVSQASEASGPSSICVAPNWTTTFAALARAVAPAAPVAQGARGLLAVSADASGSGGSLSVALPSQFDSEAVLVRVTSGQLSHTLLRPVHNSLVVEVVERLGQLRVQMKVQGAASPDVPSTVAGQGRLVETAQVRLVPLAGAYVKVFYKPKGEGGNGAIGWQSYRTGNGGSSRGRAGAVFYKDGYTDRRGWFDYAFVSTEDVEQVEQFAILVVKEGAGSVVRHVKPPKV
eukprot:TRINITY_DN7713_c0_g1_i1.p1 TRINITY_DN7713_c0_g1~~TRINITY_DN7713_c0_g1_i1.p1  ORF type:complete len:524 (-),score=55.41 TRINITY_DN7713_c0_g1_i1:204-1547(-)